MSIIKLKAKGNHYREDTGKIFFTIDDIEKLPEWPDSELIELLHGDLFMVPSPTPNHQRISQDIEFQIQSFLKKNNIGLLYHAPIDVVLSNEDLVIPDIILILNEQKDIIKKKRVEGSPALVIEIASSNKQRDLVEKKKLYEQFLVKEYIIIDPEDKISLIYRLNKNKKFDDPIQGNLPGNFIIRMLDDLEIKSWDEYSSPEI